MMTEFTRINIKILLLLTRKSSCLTARGVSPGAYPIRVVCCPGGGGGGFPPARTRKGCTTQQGLGEGVPPTQTRIGGTTQEKDLGSEVGVPPGKDLGPEGGQGTWDLL